MNILNEKEILDRMINKKLVKRSKTLKFYDSEDEEVIIRDFSSQKSKEGERKGSEPIYNFAGSKDSEGSNDSVHLEEFKILKFISKGSFGSVFLTYLPRSDSYFAIKCLQKDNLIIQDLIEKVKLEKLIMLEVEHPFIVKMHYIYQKNYRIYFVMDYIGGGELSHHI